MTILTSEVLDLAADAIERRGWQQFGGWNERADHPVCLEGGILAAMGLTQTDMVGVNGDEDAPYREFQNCPAYQAVRSYLGDQVRDCALFWWNDVLGRTQEEVVAVLRAASAVESAKESAFAPALACPA